MRKKFEIYSKTKKNTANQTVYGVIFCGGDKRDRTADLLNAIQALSQLSYTPRFLTAKNILAEWGTNVKNKYAAKPQISQKIALLFFSGAVIIVKHICNIFFVPELFLLALKKPDYAVAILDEDEQTY